LRHEVAVARGDRAAHAEEARVIRVIKRYGSRKLYDTEESRYVSLEEIGDWVRGGQQVEVVDNQTGDDVTAQTLTQVILEEGKRGVSPVSSAFLHDLIRRGEKVVQTGVQSFQDNVDRLLQASVDRVPPLRHVRDETEELRRRLELLEHQVADLERTTPAAAAPRKGNGGKTADGPQAREAASSARERSATPQGAARRKGA
jgi:polyhydroxyalkanoate synthesis repressor PhaR